MFDAPVLLDYAITLFLMSFRYRLIATFANYVGRKHSLLSGSAVVCYCLRVCFSVCFLILSVCLLVCFFLSLSGIDFLSVNQSLSCLSTNVFSYLPVSPFVCLYVSQSICLPICQSSSYYICLSVGLFVCISVIISAMVICPCLISIQTQRWWRHVTGKAIFLNTQHHNYNTDYEFIYFWTIIQTWIWVKYK